MDFFLLTMCSPDTRDVPYVPMWLICFIRVRVISGEFYILAKCSKQGSVFLLSGYL